MSDFENVRNVKFSGAWHPSEKEIAKKYAPNRVTYKITPLQGRINGLNGRC